MGQALEGGSFGHSSRWSLDRWAWSPEQGRWSLAFGLPRTPLYFEVTTDHVPPDRQYEFWRSIVYYSFDADPRPADASGSFDARSQCLVGDPAQLYHYRSDAVSGRGIPAANSDDRETYAIGLVLSGERHHQQANEPGVVSRTSQFFVFDNRWPSLIRWTAHEGLHLSLARADVESRLGGHIPPPDAMLRLLETSRMASALKTHLQMVTRCMAQASDVERTFMLGQLMQFALFVLEGATAGHAGRQERRPDLMAAALQLIEQNLWRPGFDVSALLDQLGCSRATLYRAFSDSPIGVAETIVAMRIARAKAMLAAAPEMTIGLIANGCGWYDSASFARAFRRSEGISPSEYRHRLRQA